MSSEDITFCANRNCGDTSCYRNPKRIKSQNPHSFALFPGCDKWNKSGAVWLTMQDDIFKSEEEE